MGVVQFEGTVSEKKENNDYVKFVDFLKESNEENEKETYIGEISISNIAKIFYNSLSTRNYYYEFVSSNSKVETKDIEEYLSNLWIDKDYYLEQYGYDMLFGMNT